jgi:16S rRNA (guanine966-N2)-methyltransferase
MRVIAGTLRGATIRTPGGLSVRPTYDRVRESVFSIIEPVIEGAAVLDLFAGSGSLGIESLSRGATSATFVELDRRVVSVVRENLERLGLGEVSSVMRRDVLELLGGSVPGAPFDLVFADPPYGTGLAGRTLDLLSRGDVLGDSSVVVIEHETGADVAERDGRLMRYRLKSYGTTSVGFYEARSEDAGREEVT